MKNTLKHMITITLIIFTIYTTTIRVTALEASYSSDGDSVPFELPTCDVDTYRGCGLFTQDFSIRVTLVDKDNRVIEGTHTVGFELTEDEEPYWKRADEGNGLSWEVKLNKNYTQDYRFAGSNVAKYGTGVGEEYTSETDVYAIKISYFCEPNDWTCYEENRETFFEDAINVIDRRGTIKVDGKYVSFISFFLQKSGFTDVPNGLSDTNTIRKLNEILYDSNGNLVNELKLLVEPVYTINVHHENDGKLHEFTGTAKQLALMLSNSDPNDYAWFWPVLIQENLFNFYNNMVDIYDTTIDAYKSRTLEEFNMRYEQEKIIEEQTQYNIRACSGSSGQQPNGTFGNPYSMSCSESGKTIVQNKSNLKSVTENRVFVNQAQDIFRDIAKPSSIGTSEKPSAMGISVINITDALNPIVRKKEYKNNCTYTISTCENNKFEFSSKLKLDSGSDGEIVDCVYPTNLNDKRNDLDDIIYYDSENDLWCYDDVNYSFDNLGQMRNTEYKTRQLVNIPVGELTVNRTCYSSKDLAGKPSASLNTIETNVKNKYQKEFYLIFNGENFRYKLDESTQQITQNSPGTITRNGQTIYIYKTQFKYLYKLDSGVYTDQAGANQLSIQIKDYTLRGLKGDNLSEDIITSYKGNSIITKKPDTAVYLDTLSTNKNKIDTQLKDALGLGNQLYKDLKKQSKTSTTSGNTIIDEYTKTIEQDGTTEKWTNNYKVVEKIGDSCSFLTRVKGEIDNEIAKFRVISLSNPFPARDGSSRMPGENWLHDKENNVYEYIQKNRGVTTEEVYNKEPIYKVTLTPSDMVKIREYNKKNQYGGDNLTCEKGTGRMCKSTFLHDKKYVSNLEGTCADFKREEITKFNNEIIKLQKSGCSTSKCLKESQLKTYDTNKDNMLTIADLKTAEFYSCADKTSKSGG